MNHANEFYFSFLARNTQQEIFPNVNVLHRPCLCIQTDIILFSTGYKQEVRDWFGVQNKIQYLILEIRNKCVISSE